MTTRYVSPTGDDDNPGTEASPFRNIQRAADIVNQGDTVIVKNGTYVDTNGDNIITKFTRSGTVDEPITFKSENKYGAIIDGKNGDIGLGFYITNNAKHVIIDGFDIKELYSDGIITAVGTSYVTIRNNSIHNIGNWRYNYDESSGGHASCGIVPGGNNHLFDSNLIYEIGKSEIASHYGNWDHAIYGTGEAHTVINNIIWDVWTGTALDIGWKSGLISNNVVARFTNIPRADTPDTYLVSLTSGSTDKLIIQNNIFYGCADNNSVIWVWREHDLSGSQVRNNIKYGCSDWDEGPWTGLTYSDNIDADPKFVNVANKDFHLQSTSLATGKGTLTNAPDHDFDGNPRTGRNDIGALQYVGTTQCPDLMTKLTVTKV